MTGISRLPIRTFYASLVLVAGLVILAALVYVYDPGGGTVETTTTSVSPVRPTSEFPVFLYAIEAPSGMPFRPRNATVWGNRVFVADSEGSRIGVLDLAAGPEAELSFIPVDLELPGPPDPAAGTVPPLPSEEPAEPVLVAAQPTAVGVMGDGTLVVADAANGRVWRLLEDGRLLGDLVSESEREKSGLVTPVGLVVGQREVFVTDAGDHAIKVFSTSGAYLRTLGEEGFRPGAFSYPNSVALDRDGLIYVADSNNRRIQVLREDGTVVFVIDRAEGGQALTLPRGVAFDRFGRLHVVDTFGQIVLVYGSGGQFQFSYGSEADLDRPLELPEGLALSNDRIVVSDGGNRRLVVFAY